MREGPDITRVSALIGDPARGAILGALLAGKALTAGELAREAGVTPATASSHLGQLAQAGLISLIRQWRHRYSVLDEDAAEALERLSGLAAGKGHLRTRTGPRDAELRAARVCYDHLAGSLAVRIFESMARREHLTVEAQDVTLTAAGAIFVECLGIDVGSLRARRRPLCRLCLDWSERRTHLGGSLGAALLDRMLGGDWLRRSEGSRLVTLAPGADARFDAAFPG